MIERRAIRHACAAVVAEQDDLGVLRAEQRIDRVEDVLSDRALRVRSVGAVLGRLLG